MESIILILWLAFRLVTPANPYTLEFRGQTYLANRADSLAQVVREERAMLLEAMEGVDAVERSIDSSFVKFPDAVWYQNRKREIRETRREVRDVLLVLEKELMGLE